MDGVGVSLNFVGDLIRLDNEGIDGTPGTPIGLMQGTCQQRISNTTQQSVDDNGGRTGQGV